MLPDFPEQKAVLSKLLMDYLRVRTDGRLGPFTEGARHTHHEGDVWKITREDKSEHSTDYKTISSYLQIDLREVPKLSLNDILQKLDGLAEDMAQQMGGAMINTVIQAVEEVGNTVDLGGQPITQDAFLETIRKIEMSFDELGNPHLTIVMHPDTWARFRSVAEAWDQDEAFHARFSRLLEEKRREWRDRETDRKLVD
jgi:hypothetical protein